MLTTAPERASRPLPPVAEATRVATTVLMAAAAGLAVAYGAAPAHRAWLAAENGLTDLATAVVLALVLVVSLWAIRRTADCAAWCRLVPLAALLGLADETNLGAGLFGWALPHVGEVPIDGASALLSAIHDLAVRHLGLGPMDLGAAAAVALAIGAFLLGRHRRAPRLAAWLEDHPAALHLIAAGAAAVVALTLDIFCPWQPARFAEEWLEFVAAGLLLRGALLIPGREPRAAGWRRRLRPWLEADAPRRTVPAAPPRLPS